MNTPELHFNPFAHLVSQDAVLDAIRQSQALETLRSRVYRPLDKPFLACFGKLADIDAEIDAEMDTEVDARTDGVFMDDIIKGGTFQF